MKSVFVLSCLLMLYFFNCDGHIFIKRPKSIIELHVHMPVYVIEYRRPPNLNQETDNSEYKGEVSSRSFNNLEGRRSYNSRYEKRRQDNLRKSYRQDFAPPVKPPQPKWSQPEPSPPVSSPPVSSPPVSSPPVSSQSNFNKEFNPSEHRNWKLVNDEMCGLNVENRIVGGINASLGQFPWMARVGYKNLTDKTITHKCGGVLISRKFVLTAAHCVLNLPLEFVITQIRLGEYDISKEIDCVGDLCAPSPRDFDIDYYMVHQNYGVPLSANDIALLQLNESVSFNNWISPICLPIGSLLQKNLTGSRVDIAGWGLYESLSNKESIVLQTVKLPVLNASICVKKFKRYKVNETRQLCVGGELGKDSCSGDSGGPLMKVEAEGESGPRYYLYGVVSFGATYCGLNTNPAIYTKVVHYIEWILDNMNGI